MLSWKTRAHEGIYTAYEDTSWKLLMRLPFLSAVLLYDAGVKQVKDSRLVFRIDYCFAFLCEEGNAVRVKDILTSLVLTAYFPFITLSPFPSGRELRK